MMDGDPVLFNRQPSLHRDHVNFMGLRLYPTGSIPASPSISSFFSLTHTFSILIVNSIFIYLSHKTMNSLEYTFHGIKRIMYKVVTYDLILQGLWCVFLGGCTRFSNLVYNSSIYLCTLKKKYQIFILHWHSFLLLQILQYRLHIRRNCCCVILQTFSIVLPGRISVCLFLCLMVCLYVFFFPCLSITLLLWTVCPC